MARSGVQLTDETKAIQKVADNNPNVGSYTLAKKIGNNEFPGTVNTSSVGFFSILNTIRRHRANQAKTSAVAA